MGSMEIGQRGYFTRFFGTGRNRIGWEVWGESNAMGLDECIVGIFSFFSLYFDLHTHPTRPVVR